MKLFPILSILLLSLSSTAFAQGDFNLCLDGWRKFDGALNDNRANYCRNPSIASCMAGYIRMDNAMSQARIDVCIYGAPSNGGGYPGNNGGYPGNNGSHPPIQRGDSYGSCFNAWLRFDGGMNSNRQMLCQNPSFASCMDSYMRLDGAINQARIDTCQYGSGGRPGNGGNNGGYPGNNGGYPGNNNPEYGACVNAWYRFDGAMSSNREYLCQGYGFASCMASYIRMDGAMSQARINVCQGQ